MKKIWIKIQPVLNAVDAKKGLLDKIAALLLVLCPLLQHYKGIVDNAATTVMLLVALYLVPRVLSNLKKITWSALKPVLALCGYFVFKLVAHGTSVSEVGQVVLFVGFLVSAAISCIDTKFFVKAATWVAALAGVCILVQYFCYYLLGFHLQMVPTGLFLPESKAWILGAQTGLAGVTGAIGTLYRPSAFFLEPSHLYLYSFPPLLLSLFSGNKGKYAMLYPALISVGMVLSTSGMGIAVVVVAWGLFCLTVEWKDRTFRLSNIGRKRNLILLGCLVVVFAMAVIFVPFVRRSVVRIFYSATGSTAISGRTARAIRLIKKLAWHQWFAGAADTTGANYNVPGFFAVLFKYGLIGVVLSYWVYIRSIFKLDQRYFCIGVVIVITSFFSAHTHGTFYMLFYVLILLEGEKVSRGSLVRDLGSGIQTLCRNIKGAINKKHG